MLIGPLAVAVPTLETVTGNELNAPDTNAGLGCPTAVTTSGAGAAPTGVVAVIGAAALFVVELSPTIGSTEPVTVGFEPIVVAFGVTGTLNIDDVPFVIGFDDKHATT